MTGTCVSQIADPDKPGRLYECDRGQHTGGHHTVNDRGEDITWGEASRGKWPPRPAAALFDAYIEHTRAVKAQQAAPSEDGAARLRAAVDAVTREEAAYSADCIAAGWAPLARPMRFDGIDS